MSKKVLLLEGIHESAVDSFRNFGFDVECVKGSLHHDELMKQIKECHVLGIRSRTHVNQEVLKNASNLLTIGCFCIGTNQVDLDAAKLKGIPVFNAPYSNTRSVAELVIGEIVMLFRQMCARQIDMHQGIWNKSAKNNFEMRGKNLGIIGYGHIGSQVATLAEAMGMHVFYYDLAAKLPLGNAKPVDLETLLKLSDVVTLHVPQTPLTNQMFDADLMRKMKKGSYLINASRGNVVVIEDFISALNKGHLMGGALDVFPAEPKANGEQFESPLTKYNNVILTPHIGGSTEESQLNIGLEVSQKVIDFVTDGILNVSVNFPDISLPQIRPNHDRYIHIHHNSPGVLKEINSVFLDQNTNILAQYLNTDSKIGYVVTDVEKNSTQLSLHQLENLLKIVGTLSCRVANFSEQGC